MLEIHELNGQERFSDLVEMISALKKVGKEGTRPFELLSEQLDLEAERLARKYIKAYRDETLTIREVKRVERETRPSDTADFQVKRGERNNAWNRLQQELQETKRKLEQYQGAAQ